MRLAELIRGIFRAKAEKDFCLHRPDIAWLRKEYDRMMEMEQERPPTCKEIKTAGQNGASTS